MPSDALLIYCSCPDRKTGQDLARTLVDRGLAACVNVTGPMDSLYRWQGETEQAQEYQLLIKTSRPRYPALEECLCSLHPYELPEIIAVPVEQGSAAYLNWIDACTKTA